MFEVNVSKLRGKMAECGYTKSSFASACGIHISTLNRYLKNPDKLTVGVMDTMVGLLCENAREAAEIFFSLKLT